MRSKIPKSDVKFNEERLPSKYRKAIREWKAGDSNRLMKEYPDLYWILVEARSEVRLDLFTTANDMEGKSNDMERQVYNKTKESMAVKGPGKPLIVIKDKDQYKKAIDALFHAGVVNENKRRIGNKSISTKKLFIGSFSILIKTGIISVTGITYDSDDECAIELYIMKSVAAEFKLSNIQEFSRRKARACCEELAIRKIHEIFLLSEKFRKQSPTK